MRVMLSELVQDCSSKWLLCHPPLLPGRTLHLSCAELRISLLQLADQLDIFSLRLASQPDIFSLQLADQLDMLCLCRCMPDCTWLDCTWWLACA